MTYLQITVRFLDERYHGLFDRNGPPEWPPSPFRLFAAMVAGVAQRNALEDGASEALCWLQKLCREQPPTIIAPRAHTGNAIVRYGPDNDDKFHNKPEECRSAKPTIPTLMALESGQEPEVHYLWALDGITDIPVEGLRGAARKLTRLGWGIDMAFADARLVSIADIQNLKGIRWHPKPGVWREFGMLRLPTTDNEGEEGTLSDLKHCHQTGLNRMKHGAPRRHVEKPRVFDRVFYASAERAIGRPYAVFELRSDGGHFHVHSQRRLMHIAGMVRHLAIRAMGSKQLLEQLYPDHDQVKDPFRDGSPPADVLKHGDWHSPDEWVLRYVVGHREKGCDNHAQFAYVPLPTIGHPHADQAIRRVMLIAPSGDDGWLEHLARRLAGQRLVPEQGNELGGDEPPYLHRVQQDNIARFYTRPATRWASVTPVILPGHDDKKPAKTRKLIEKALAQSGIETPCTYEWSAFSRFSKSYSAHKYDKEGKPVGYLRPHHLLEKTAVHLTLTFENGLEVPGPLTIGAGRHCGFGLMAKIED